MKIKLEAWNIHSSKIQIKQLCAQNTILFIEPYLKEFALGAYTYRLYYMFLLNWITFSLHSHFFLLQIYLSKFWKMKKKNYCNCLIQGPEGHYAICELKATVTYFHCHYLVFKPTFTSLKTKVAWLFGLYTPPSLPITLVI